MSETAERAPASGSPADPAVAPGQPGARASSVGRIGIRLVQQREATVFVVAVALVIYFSSVSSSFFTRDDLVNLSQIIAPLAIIACGEVFLLICGELDLSVGFVYGFAPFLMHYLIDFYSVPAIPAMILCLVFGLAFGYINAFITIALGVPSFIATLGTGLVLLGFTLTTSNAYPALIPDSAAGPGHWIGTYAWAMITWAIVLVIFFQILLSRTKWGLHTVAVGGNILGASEAGINVEADQVRQLHDHRHARRVRRPPGRLPDQQHRPQFRRLPADVLRDRGRGHRRHGAVRRLRHDRRRLPRRGACSASCRAASP